LSAADEAAPCHGVRQQSEPQHGGACVVAEARAGRELVWHRDECQVAWSVGQRTECVSVRDAVSADAGRSQEQRPGIVSSFTLLNVVTNFCVAAEFVVWNLVLSS